MLSTTPLFRKGYPWSDIMKNKKIKLYFPEKDGIFDFMNPWYDKELEKIIKQYAEWYPIKKLELTMH